MQSLFRTTYDNGVIINQFGTLKPEQIVLTPPTAVRHLFITVVGIILCYSQIEMLVNSLHHSFNKMVCFNVFAE